MLTQTQKQTAKAIVNIFETNSVLGDYGMVTLLAGDTGHLTFGRSQTTLGSGNLYKLLQTYCDNPNALFSYKLKPYLSRFELRDLSLDHERYLHNILRASADDPVMRETQDDFFDRVYWQTAERNAGRSGISSPLGVAVVYDSTVHGSWQYIRDKTNATRGSVAALGEHKWIAAYVKTRRNWLANHSNRILRNTIYRIDALQRLIDLNLWKLDLPLVVRGREISQITLGATPTGCFDGPVPGSRALLVQLPLMRGLDVRLLQLELSRNGIDVIADGVFGNASLRAINAYQRNKGLPTVDQVDAHFVAEFLA